MLRLEFAVQMNSTPTRQVERHVEVVVAESVVLGRVEDFEKRGRGIATIIPTELVDLVEHHYGVVHARPTQCLDQAPRHRTDVRSPVATQFGLVVHAAKAKAFKKARSGGPGDRLSERCLAPRPALSRHRIGAFAFRVQLEDGEMFEDTLLDAG